MGRNPQWAPEKPDLSLTESVTGERTGDIRRANLDGSNAHLVKDLMRVLGGIAIDAVNDKLYITKPVDVTLTIYGVNGQVVRALALGHQAAGTYQSRSRAAYWDGRNEYGEPVASGLYFYTLTTGDFTATRKMLIRK